MDRFVSPFVIAAVLLAQADTGTFVIPNFRFESGETLPAVRIHYRTMGRPRRDAAGVVRNAVLILHGTGGSGANFLSPSFVELYGAGQALDTATHYIILPDNIGHGASSKPSDGLHARFPRYGYNDMVEAQYRLVTAGLHVDHLLLVMGTSMGCMHSWLWAERYPVFMDGVVPLACAPTQIAGRNRMMRKMILDDIRTDPEWRGGEYATQPRGLRAALQILYLMGSAPLVAHRAAPTRDSADAVITRYVDGRMATTDANDMIYQFDASRDYDPSPGLERITAPVLAINSADDLINPPELGLMERLIARVARGRYVLIPTSDITRGHGTHTVAAAWKAQFAPFVAALERRRGNTVPDIDALLAEYTGPDVPGAGVVVIQDGRVVLRRAYGMAHLERHVPATPETDYRLASVSKQFTAMAIMLLAKDRKLRYDQPVRDILPELPPSAQGVTVRHLLNHTSGLPDYEDLIPDAQTVQVSDHDVLALLARKDTLYFPAGTQYRYSNSGYVLLGLIVERLSGVSFPSFLRAHIFAPLGMTASVAHVEGADTVPHRAYGYSPDPSGFKPTDQSVTSATLGDGGIYTNVDDLVRWDAALYGNKLVDARALRLATTPPVLPAGAETQYGFGWFVDSYRGVKRWRHTGETSGFRNAIQRYPDRRFTVIVLTNRNGGEPAAIAERIVDQLLFGAAAAR
jgi:homoserine O-acetyltransferase